MYRSSTRPYFLAKTAHRLCKLLLCVFGIAVGTSSTSAIAEQYPSKPLRMIVPSVAGGILDTVGRTVAAKLAEQMGQPVIVENKPGAGSTIGSEAILKLPADGYTLLAVATGHAINPAVYKKLPYDTVRDFQPVSHTVNLTNVLVVHPSIPAGNVRELIAYGKANPGKLTFGSAGNGQSNHLSGELFKSLTGLDMTHVPYKGSAAALADVLAGNVSMMFVDVLSASSHVKAGKLKAIGITGTQRSAAAPEFQTIAEQGVSGFNGNSWLGVVVRAGTPKEIVARLSAEIAKALKSPEVRERFLAQGVEPVGSTAEQFAAHIEAEMPRWARAVQVSGAKID